MSFKKNIDDILEQIKNCHDPTEQKRLLEEINPCKTCPDGKQPSCQFSCKQHYQVVLFNIVEQIKQKVSVPEFQNKSMTPFSNQAADEVVANLRKGGYTAMDWKKIIIGVDDEPRSINAVEYVGSIAGHLDDVYICLLHIYPEPPPDYSRSGASLDEYKRAQDAQAEILFARSKKILLGHGIAAISITTKCLMAENKSISAAILDMQVQEHYGTIVVGKRGIPKAEEFLFGSISNALIHTGRDIAVWVIG